jgi:hypothetical protein
MEKDDIEQILKQNLVGLKEIMKKGWTSNDL